MENMVGQAQSSQVLPPSKVTIQVINNPAPDTGTAISAPVINEHCDAPIYPANYYTKNLSQSEPEIKDEPKLKAKVETKISEKNDISHIKNDMGSLKAYLGDKKHKERRLLGANAVVSRLQDHTDKKDDAELNGLVNTMLNDKYEIVKFLAMAALESGDAKGNDETVEILQQIKQNKSDDVIDKENSRKASNILTKMSVKTEKVEIN